MQLLSAAVVLLCSAALLLGLNLVDLHRQVARDRDADKIIEQLDKTTNHLLGIEVAVRGYALFGNPQLLGRYEKELSKLAAAMAALGQLTADTPLHKSAMERIRRAVGVRIKIASHVMSMTPDPPIRLAIALRDAKSRGSIDAARDAIAGMRLTEEEHRERMAAATEQKAVYSFALAAAIVVVSMLVGALGTSFTLFGARAAPLQSQRSPTR